MPDQPAASSTGQQIPVSANNPCPFLRGLVANGYVDGHTVPLPKLTATIEAATGEVGLKRQIAGMEIYGIALTANGWSPLRVIKSWWSGADLDELRNGPLDKHGAGSRILTVDGQVDESEIERLATFGSDYTDPNGGGTERGLNAQQITTFMNANFERAKGNQRPIYRLFMQGEWPVLLKIMGKGEGDSRYLSVAEVRTLFVERAFPQRIVLRLKEPAPAPSLVVTFVKGAFAFLFSLAVLLGVAITQFPDQLRSVLAALPGKMGQLSQLLPPPLVDPPAVKEARWLEQNWSLDDRHWFHHVSQGTATFPVPYAWFVALEQPNIHLFSQPGLLSDTAYLERFGFIPSPKTIHTDKATLQRFGYADAPNAPDKWHVENFDGLPVGFARLTGATDPATGAPKPDLIGLTCAACHTGSIRYKGTSIRYDGGPAMVNLLSLEEASTLSFLYTLYVPGRFDRFAARVLGAHPTAADLAELRKGLKAALNFALGQKKALDNTSKATGLTDTEEGYGRLDALNRIGNQVFATDLGLSGLPGSEKNLHMRDAPVSFPPIWTVPWFSWAQYDASISQPLIRNAGEALGVSALVNLSPENPIDALFRSSVDVKALDEIETTLRGPNPFEQNPKGFGGLRSPKWPAQMFPDDPAWKIDPARVDKGRKIYAEICVECHLGPVADPAFDQQFPDKSFWKDSHWNQSAPVLNEVQKHAKGMGTDPQQANVLILRKVEVPGFLDFQPARDLGQVGECPNLPAASSEMSYALALMIAVDRTARKWMDDHHISEAERSALWADRKNCPNPAALKVPPEPLYRARPLNGVWATAPYLHNGSVPSLYWMLRPAAERPKQFCMGMRDFDPKQVGFRVEEGEKTSCRHGETKFMAVDGSGKPILGNSVAGHSLEGTPGPGKDGVIGRLLTDDERYDLIEYLKTL